MLIVNPVFNFQVMSPHFRTIVSKVLDLTPVEAETLTHAEVRTIDNLPVVVLNRTVGDVAPVEEITDIEPNIIMNLVRIYELLANNTELTQKWIETFLISKLASFEAGIEFIVVPTMTEETISGILTEYDDSGNGQVMDIIVYDSVMIPRYNRHGLIMNEELLTATPVEFGSEQRKHHVRVFPVVQVGDRIAINQHIGVEVLSTPRLNVDEDYPCLRTGYTKWYSNGYSKITKVPEGNVDGEAVGDDGLEYSINLGGAWLHV